LLGDEAISLGEVEGDIEGDFEGCAWTLARIR